MLLDVSHGPPLYYYWEWLAELGLGVLLALRPRPLYNIGLADLTGWSKKRAYSLAG